MEFFLVFLFLVICVSSQAVTCGSGFIAYERAGESKSIACNNVTVDVVFVPPLPKGLTYVDGMIKGAPLVILNRDSYTIRSQGGKGVIVISSNDNLTIVDIGFKQQMIYINAPINPMRVYTDCSTSSFTISPDLTDGLVFDNVLGIISGTYTGSEKVVDYTITGFYKTTSITSVFRLDYKAITPSIYGGYSICYYDYLSVDNLNNSLYYDIVRPVCCGVVQQPLNFTQDYYVEHVYRWPGLREPLESSFESHLTGYLDVNIDATYKIRIHGSGSNRMSIDRIDVATIIGSGSNINVKTITITLTKGLHLIDIFSVFTMDISHLSVEWSEVDDVWTTLDSTSLRFGGRAPSFMENISLSTIIGQYMNTTLPSTSINAALQYTITPELPASLKLFNDIGVIRGTPTEMMSIIYTLTATNPMGYSSSSLHILVDQIALQGLMGTYTITDESRDVCTYTNIRDYERTVYTQRLEDRFDFPYQPRYGWWPYVPAAIFVGQAYIKWEGMIDVETPGEWKMKIVKTDGILITINGERQTRSYSCKGDVSDYIVSMELTKGYLPIQIEYFTNKNHFIFELSIMKPGETQFNKIPSGLFQYIPKQVLSLSTYQNRFIKGKAIESIRIFSFGVTMINPIYSSFPILPTGLSINDKGIITGTPLSVFPLTTFIIKAQNNEQIYTVPIKLSSVDIPSPKSIIILDINKQLVTNITLMMYSMMNPLEINIDVSNCFISIIPLLPTGLILNSSQYPFTITGTPHYSISLSHYTIIATNEAGTIETYLSILIPKCQYGQYIYAQSSGNELDFYLEKDNKIIFKAEKQKSDSYLFSFCVPVDDYHVAIRASSTGWVYSFVLAREDGLVYIKESPDERKWLNRTLEIRQKIPPIFSMNISHYVANVGEEIRIPFLLSGLYIPIYSEPVLPSSFLFEIRFKEMRGTFTTEGIYDFTIICKNDAGIVNIPFIFYIDRCPEGTIMIHGSKKDSGLSDRFDLIDTQGILQVQRFLIYSYSNDIIFCITNERYIIRFYTDDTIKEYSRPLSLYGPDNELLIIYEFNKGMIEESVFQFIQLFTPNDLWKVWINTKNVGKKWHEINYKDNKWSLLSSNQFGKFNNNMKTVYLRRVIIIDDTILLSYIRLKVTIIGGFILYINSQEAIRMNLQSGELNRDIMATRTQDLSKGQWIELNSSLLHIGSNIIAVEYHCYDTVDPTSQIIRFELYHNQLPSLSMMKSNEGYASCSQSEPNKSTPEEAFFDTNDYTYWEDSKLPAWLRFTFPNNERRFVNRMIIRGSLSNQNHPVIFEIIGILNETILINGILTITEIKESIKIVNDPYMYDTKFCEILFILNPKKSYQAYEIIIHRTLESEDTVRINYIKYFSEYQSYCYGDKKWINTLSNTVAYGKCGLFELGKTKRECKRQGTKAEWQEIDKESCLSRFPGKNLAFVDVRYRIYNCTMKLYESIVKEELKNTIVREITVKEEDISFYLPTPCSEDTDYPSICVDIRLKPHRLTSQYVKYEMSLFHLNMTGAFYKKASPTVPRYIQILHDSNVKVRESMTGKDVMITIVIIVLVIICLAQMVVYLKITRNGRNSTRKTLPKTDKVKLPKKPSNRKKLI